MLRILRIPKKKLEIITTASYFILIWRLSYLSTLESVCISVTTYLYVDVCSHIHKPKLRCGHTYITENALIDPKRLHLYKCTDTTLLFIGLKSH